MNNDRQIMEKLARIERQLPHRLRDGHYLVGPEYVGCSGTGLRPRLACRRPFFYVGTEAAPTAHRYKTYRGAKNAFLRGCGQVVRYNVETMQRAHAARARLQADPFDADAALELGDLGV